MAQAYEAFDNQGVQMQEHLITKIQNMQGDTIYTYQPAAKRIMSAQTAAVMTQLLQNVVNQGTGTNAQVPGWQVAGKTGTVQYGTGETHPNWLNRVWFDGYTGNMVGSVTLGYDTSDASHHLVDFPDPVANCAKVFSDMITLAEQGVQPVPLNSSSAASAPTQQQVQNVPITGLGASYNAGLNSVTLHWTSQASGQQLAFVVSRTTVSTPAPNPAGGAGGAGGQDGNATATSQGGTTGSASQGTAGSAVVLGKVEGTSFIDPNVQPGATYQYSVQPVDASSQQPVGQPALVTVLIPGGTATAPGPGAGSQNPGGQNAPGGQNSVGNDTPNGQPGTGVNNTPPGTGTNTAGLIPPSPQAEVFGGKQGHHKH